MMKAHMMTPNVMLAFRSRMEKFNFRFPAAEGETGTAMPVVVCTLGTWRDEDWLSLVRWLVGTLSELTGSWFSNSWFNFWVFRFDLLWLVLLFIAVGSIASLAEEGSVDFVCLSCELARNEHAAHTLSKCNCSRFCPTFCSRLLNVRVNRDFTDDKVWDNGWRGNVFSTATASFVASREFVSSTKSIFSRCVGNFDFISVSWLIVSLLDDIRRSTVAWSHFKFMSWSFFL